MKLLIRVLLFLVTLALFVGGVGILTAYAEIPLLSSFVLKLTGNLIWLKLAFAIVILVFIAACVLALVLIVSVPTKNKVFIVRRGIGNIEITRQSIESAAGHALSEIPEVKRYHVRLKGHPSPDRVKLYIEVEPKDPATELVTLGDEVQRRVSKNLDKYLTVDPTHIKVKIHLYSHGDEAESHHQKKAPRVI